jgi:hypothetical protein
MSRLAAAGALDPAAPTATFPLIGTPADRYSPVQSGCGSGQAD